MTAEEARLRLMLQYCLQRCDGSNPCRNEDCELFHAITSLGKTPKRQRQVINSYQHKIKKYHRDTERYKKEAASAKELIDCIYREAKIAVEHDIRMYGDWIAIEIDKWRDENDR